MAAIIPDSAENRLSFFNNLKTQITAKASQMGWDTGKVTAVEAVLDPIATAYDELVEAEETVVVKSADAAQALKDRRPDLEKIFDEIKANPGLSAGDIAEMRLVTTSDKPQPADMKPKIRAVAYSGFVRLTGSKDYADLVNVMMRRTGEAEWTMVGYRRQKFPFEDQTPLKTAGVPEVREYMARCVVNDAEVGHPSDIVQVTFAG